MSCVASPFSWMPLGKPAFGQKGSRLRRIEGVGLQGRVEPEVLRQRDGRDGAPVPSRDVSNEPFDVGPVEQGPANLDARQRPAARVDEHVHEPDGVPLEQPDTLCPEQGVDVLWQEVGDDVDVPGYELAKALLGVGDELEDDPRDLGCSP